MLTSSGFNIDTFIIHDIMTDWREPNVIRVAPVPLYNTFQEVFQFVEALKSSLMQGV